MKPEHIQYWDKIKDFTREQKKIIETFQNAPIDTKTEAGKIFDDALGDLFKIFYESNNRSKPSWDDAPDWAESLVQEANGSWTWRSDIPNTDNGLTWGSDQFEGRTACASWNNNWRETLELRPEKNKKPKATCVYLQSKAGKKLFEVTTTDGEKIVAYKIKEY